MTTPFRCSSILNLPGGRLCITVFMVFSASFIFLLVTLGCVERGWSRAGVCAGVGAGASTGVFDVVFVVFMRFCVHFHIHVQGQDH